MKLENIDTIVKFIEKHRIKPTIIFDQTSCTLDTLKKRVDIFLKNDDIVDKKMIFIGDDDLLSVACALTKLPSKITVIDIDKRIIDTINSISLEKNVDIETYLLDIRNPIPKGLPRNNEVFFADPPYTKLGIKLFASRGFETVKKNSFGYICIPSNMYASNIVDEIVEMIKNSGIDILEFWKDFNDYVPIDGLVKKGFKSSLVKIKINKNFRSLNKISSDEIYAFNVYGSVSSP